MNQQAKPPSKTIKVFKNQLWKCRQTGRMYGVVDALLSHKPILLPGKQIAGDVQGIVLQTVIPIGDLRKFSEVKPPKPQKQIVTA